MRHGSLFSGIGGFDLAAEWMGWENVFHCEWNEFGQKILKYYWPNAISYGDITKTDFTIHRGSIDILTGGFPCQPFSAAGMRKGTADDRHLWPEMLRAIREVSPSYIVGENVRGITNWNGGLVFDQVQADLEAEGFEVLPFLLPACAVNAPHRRDRVWFIGHACGFDRHIPIQQRGQIAACDINTNRPNESRTTANTKNIGHESSGNTREWRPGFEDSNSWPTPNPNGSERPERRLHKAERKEAERHFSPRDASFNQRATWQDFPTQSPVCSRDDEFSSRLDGITFPKWRNESIKGYGNAVVPELVYRIFQSIESADKTNNREEK